MNHVVYPFILGSFVAWCAALIFRRSVWAFCCWLPFSCLSAVATLAWLAVIPQLGNSGGGAGAGFAALGMAMAFLMLLAAPFLLFLSIRFRPLYYQPAVVGITVVTLGVGLPVIWGASVSASRQPVHLVFLSTDGSLIPGVSVRFESRNKVNGFSAPVISGSAVSAADGAVTVFTRSTHELNLDFKLDTFAPTSMRIERSFPSLGQGRQCSMSWQIDVPGERWPKSRSELFYVPDGAELTVTVYLPRLNEANLPYPNL
jgi:hypothetical protein